MIFAWPIVNIKGFGLSAKMITLEPFMLLKLPIIALNSTYLLQNQPYYAENYAQW